MHPDAPVDFLYVHAIELFLKSYLRLNKTVQELKDIGHKLRDLQEVCADLFPEGNTKLNEIMTLISENRINANSRYIYTGTYNNSPTHASLQELCNFLYDTIKPKMIEAGFSVR